MFTRLKSLMQLRRSTAFLLNRADDRLLDDIGLTRGDLLAMHEGLGDDSGAANARILLPLWLGRKHAT
ncbi:DUF1127 domain-containing protein [Xinfangfangia sp. D13-10-4-6]|uniref:DUF1127 domain-containing protein n=1 Tax=Pseudogemmobacter hezensis TaxID=2737662 RepID=UPI001552FF53|nr:DUF1127 domain-containing protein [Pseudogemmobacter hezensis]NPD15474.1 DUF1127 domain-containing protein [Pseudogemmobacter hezensis]